MYVFFVNNPEICDPNRVVVTSDYSGCGIKLLLTLKCSQLKIEVVTAASALDVIHDSDLYLYIFHLFLELLYNFASMQRRKIINTIES